MLVTSSRSSSMRCWRSFTGSTAAGGVAIIAADGRTPLQQIVEQHVCAAFDVTLEEAMKDAESFVQELAAHGILKLSEEPIL